jgi:hypothetical protein
MRTVTLIGGKFHRLKVEVESNSFVYRIAIPSNFSVAELNNLHCEPNKIETIEYAQVASIFGKIGIFPEDMFLLSGIDPVEFLKNIVLAYVR